MTEKNNKPLLPRGVNSANFEQAIAKFRKLLGDENVLTKDDQLIPYSKIMIAVDNAEHTPSAAVTATTVEQVQGVVKICNEHKIPVWTISTGRNFGYGSAAPGQRGQVILDLKKMNKILHVDPELCTALVEPGVTYQQLYDYIQEHQLPLMLSFSAPSAIAGPLGNTMDRGVGYTPYGEHFLMQCGMEVVLAFDGGYGGMVMGDQGTLTLACCIRQDRLDACRAAAPGQSAGEVVEAMLKRECLGVAQALAGAQRSGAWLASGPIDPGIRLREDDALFRIGNAAGEAHPIIGEGMSMAMQSAWLLCAALLQPTERSNQLTDPQWQAQVRQRYHAQWRRHFALRLRLAALFAHAAMRPWLSVPMLAGLRYWPSLLTHGARWGGKVDCAVDAASIAWLAAGPGASRMTDAGHPAAPAEPLPSGARF